jgi:hypothetical protein
MATSDLFSAPPQHRLWPLVLLALGMLLIGLSFLPSIAVDGRSEWTDEKALQYQEASATLHGLAHEIGHAPENPGVGTNSQQQLEAAQARFDELRRQLQAARSRSINWALALRSLGVVFAIVGSVAYFAKLRRRIPELRDYHRVRS